MTRTALLALMAAIGLSGAGRALAATDGTARAAALEALAAKADLPASRPVLPSILTDPDARMGLRDDGQGGGNGNGKDNAKSEAPGQMKKEAQADVAKVNAAAANSEAARAAGQASADANDAAEKKREKATREKHPKPPHPPKGGGN